MTIKRSLIIILALLMGLGGCSGFLNVLKSPENAPSDQDEESFTIKGTVGFLLGLFSQNAYALVIGTPAYDPDAEKKIFTTADLIQAQAIARLSTYQDPAGLQDLTNSKYCDNSVCSGADTCAKLLLIPSQSDATRLGILRTPYQVCQSPVVGNQFDFSLRPATLVKELLPTSALRVLIEDSATGSVKVRDFVDHADAQENSVAVDSTSTLSAIMHADSLFSSSPEEEIQQGQEDTKAFLSSGSSAHGQLNEALLNLENVQASDLLDPSDPDFVEKLFQSPVLAAAMKELIETSQASRASVEALQPGQEAAFDSLIQGLSGAQFLEMFGGPRVLKRKLARVKATNFLDLAKRVRAVSNARQKLGARDISAKPGLIRADLSRCARWSNSVLRQNCASVLVPTITQQSSTATQWLPGGLNLDTPVDFGALP